MGQFFFMVLDAQIAHLFFKNFPKSSQAKFGFKNGLKGHEFLLFFLESRCFFGLGSPGSLFSGYLGAPEASNLYIFSDYFELLGPGAYHFHITFEPLGP